MSEQGKPATAEIAQQTCDFCKSVVESGNFCLKCARPLKPEWKRDQEEEEELDQYEKELRGVEKKQDDFALKYSDMQRDLQQNQNTFSRFFLFRDLRQTMVRGLRKITVPKGWKATVYDNRGDVIDELKPGTHSITKSGANQGVLSALFNVYQESHLSVFMHNANEFQVTFIVPEYDPKNPKHQYEKSEIKRLIESLGHGERPVYTDLNVCNITSADGFLGGVSVSMVMQIENPGQLLMSLIETPEGQGRNSLRFVDLFREPWYYFKTFFGFDENGEIGDDGYKYVDEFNQQKLWEFVRNEFVQVMRTAIINETASEMALSRDVNTRLKKEISSGLDTTFERFGLAVKDVTAFSFLCPDYDIVRNRKRKIALKEEELDNEQTKARLRNEYRSIEQAESLHSNQTIHTIETEKLKSSEELNRLKLEEEGKRKEIEDKNRSFAAERERLEKTREKTHQLEQDSRDQQHRRLQEKADEQDKLAKAEQWLQLKNKALDAEMQRRNQMANADLDRRMQYMRMIAETGLSSDSILAAQLMDRPELADAYAKAVQSRGLEERLLLQKEFESKLLSINTTDKQQVQRLLEVGIQQIGNVMAESQRKQRPNIVATPGSVYQLNQSNESTDQNSKS